VSIYRFRVVNSAGEYRIKNLIDCCLRLLMRIDSDSDSVCCIFNTASKRPNPIKLYNLLYYIPAVARCSRAV